MSDDEYRNGFGEEALEDNSEKAEEPEIVEEIVTEEVVATQDDDDDDSETRLEGAIGSGNLESDYPEDKAGETEAEAPAETEESAEAEAPAEAEEKAEAVAAEAEPAKEEEKKSKKGLIIGIIVTVVLLLGAGAGFLIWYLVHESPAVMLRDALSNFWSADNYQMSGTVSTNAGGKDVNIEMSGVRAGGNFSGSGTIKAEYGGKDIEVEFSSSYIKGGDFYFKLDGLKKLMESIDFDEIFGGGLSSADQTGGLSTLLSTVLNAVVEKVDGSWYKISIGSIKQHNAELGCISETIDDILASDAKDAFIDAYKENSFINLDEKANSSDRDGAKYFKVTIDEDKSKAFSEKLQSNEAFKKLAKCVESDDTSDEPFLEFNDEEEDDEEDSVETAKPEVSLEIGIKPWSHELVGIKMSTTQSGVTTDLDWTIKYGGQTVSEPADAKTLDSLQEVLSGALQEGMTEYLKSMCESMYGEYGDEYVQLCIESASESMSSYFDDIDMSTLFQQFGGGESISL